MSVHSNIHHTDTWRVLMDVISRAASLDSSRRLPLILSSLPEMPEYDIEGPPISFIHGPPGRNIALAIGLGAARPNKPLILIMNADAVTLGMNHLIHAARRNMGMTLLILREEVTEAVELNPVMRTNWRSYGFQDGIERKATPLELATGLEAASVARGSIDHVEQLAQLISDAMNTSGFSMVGITSDNSLPLGVLSSAELPEYFNSYRNWSASIREALAEEKGAEEKSAKKKKDIEAASPKEGAAERYEIRIAGIGGQGVKLAGSVISDAAGTYEGLWTTQRGEYGSATRGGPSLVEVIAGSNRVGYPRADNPDVLVLLDKRSASQYADSVKPTGQTVADIDQIEELPKGAIGVPIGRLSIEHTGRTIAAGVVSLGCIAAVSDVVSIESLKKSVAMKLPPKLVEKNIAALQAGYDATCSALKGDAHG